MVTDAALGDDTRQPAIVNVPNVERRAAARYTSLIRAAKLVTAQGEFACVVRDVSRSGTKLRLFHPLPPGCQAAVLELQNGERYGMRLVHAGEGAASFMFSRPVAVERLVREHWTHPRRPFRLRLRVPVSILQTGHDGSDQPVEGHLVNLSQRGARVETSATLKRGHGVRLESPDDLTLCAEIRWRLGEAYGLVLERPFTLEEIALLAARLQWPAMPLRPLPQGCSSRMANN